MELLLIVLLIISVLLFAITLLLARAIINEKISMINSKDKVIKALLEQLDYNS